jgi:Ni,Fe-hydrogenase III small subunit
MNPSAVIRAGACDFNAKPFELNLLDLVLTRAVNHRRLQKSIRKSSQVIYGLPEIVGDLNAIIPVDIYNPGCPSHPFSTLHCLPASFKIEHQEARPGRRTAPNRLPDA